MSDFETQARIIHKSNQIRDEIKNLLEWEKDMKDTEAKRIASVNGNQNEFEQNYPMRNQMETAIVSSTTSDCVNRKMASPNSIDEAEDFKSRGNQLVQKGQYQNAIRYYREAIRLNESEPVYYTNRALCYLKLNRFTECINDCSTAIKLDDKAVKAYYRRMQAIEQMDGDLKAAIDDCKSILRMDPKNIDAQRSLKRLENAVKITTNEIKLKSVLDEQWSQFDGDKNYERIDFVLKPPHLRSKTQFKRIEIIDSDSKIKPNPIECCSNCVEDNELMNTTDNDQTMAVAKPAEDQNKKFIDFPVPQNSAQFYKIWKEINDSDQKFRLLMNIYHRDIGKILGAQFSLDILREIFTILKNYFFEDKLNIGNILDGIVRNSQMPIISAMMNNEDKSDFSKLVAYMQLQRENAKQIATIQKTYEDLISM